jgi:hypothetical protein
LDRAQFLARIARGLAPRDEIHDLIKDSHQKNARMQALGCDAIMHLPPRWNRNVLEVHDVVSSS